MRKLIIGALLAGALLLGLLIWFVGLPEHAYQLVSPEYNISALFPDKPSVLHSVNDEGLPKTVWTIKHDHGTWTEYFELSATCYNEVLDPAKEFEGADVDPALALNGIRVIESGRTTVQALETGRELQAFARISEDSRNKAVLAHKVILDGHCMIDYSARMDKNEGAAALFMGGVKILK